MNIRVLTLALALAPVLHAQQTTLPLWPHGTPEPPLTSAAEYDATVPSDGLLSGHRTRRLTNISVPTLSVYPPTHHGNGAAALVFPGGGYRILAWDGEGLDACAWLNSLNMTCLLVKYRVPRPPGDAGHYPADHADLEDAQQAMRLARSHAADWHLDPNRIGVLGFSAGANLAVLLSTHPDDTHVLSTPARADVPASGSTPAEARANFAVLVYPAYLAAQPAETTLDPAYTPNAFTPPTFLIQAQDDRGYGHNALVYYRALMDARVPAELHYYATGGHGFGMHPTGRPEQDWPDLAAAWLRSLHMLPALPPRHPDPGPSTGSPTPSSTPCPITVPQAPQPGLPTPPQPIDPNCPPN